MKAFGYAAAEHVDAAALAAAGAVVFDDMADLVRILAEVGEARAHGEP